MCCYLYIRDCSKPRGCRHQQGHLKTRGFCSPWAIYITFPTLHFPCKELYNLMDPYRRGFLQALSGWGFNLREIRELWWKDIKIDRICFWRRRCGAGVYEGKEEVIFNRDERSSLTKKCSWEVAAIFIYSGNFPSSGSTTVIRGYCQQSQNSVFIPVVVQHQ